MKDNNYYPALTGIRAIAAFMVCLFHFNPFTEKIFGKYIHNFFGEFHVGVTVFFVLSGFLICIRYYGDVGRFDYYKYFTNRFSRIYPVYFILTTIYFLFVFAPSQQNFKEWAWQFFLNITLFKGFFEHYMYSGILPAWSLTVEETFYFLAPVALFLAHKNKLNLLFFAVFIILIGLSLVAIFGYRGQNGFFHNYPFMFSFTFFGRVTEFVIGMFLALLVLNTKNTARLPSKKIIFTTTGLLFSVVCIFLISCFKTDVIGIEHPTAKLVNNFFLPLLGIAPLFYGLITEESPFKKLLETKIFQLLGKSSYVFYLIHLSVGSIHDNFIFVLFISTIISIFIFKYIEEPFNKFFRTKFAQS